MKILGLGTAVPPHRMSQDEALEMTSAILCRDDKQRRLLRMLFRQSGIENRHTVVPYRTAYEWAKKGVDPHDPNVRHGAGTAERMALYARHAREIAERASANALEKAAVDSRDVTHVVTVSCTGFDAPGVDVHLIRRLGLPPTTQRVNVGFMGCHGALNGLRVARGLASDPGATVLLCAVECCSLHYWSTWNPERVLGNALFADGAAALVLRNGDAPASRAGGWEVRDTGSCLIEGTEDAMGWRIGDHGFEMRLTSRVAHAIEGNLRVWLEGWLADRGVAMDDVAHWAVHPGGPRVVDAVESSLGLENGATDVSRRVLAEYGNMSSPTVLFVLDRLGTPRGPCVLLGFGPGLVAEAALLMPVADGR